MSVLLVLLPSNVFAHTHGHAWMKPFLGSLKHFNGDFMDQWETIIGMYPEQKKWCPHHWGGWSHSNDTVRHQMTCTTTITLFLGASTANHGKGLGWFSLILMWSSGNVSFSAMTKKKKFLHCFPLLPCFSPFSMQCRPWWSNPPPYISFPVGLLSCKPVLSVVLSVLPVPLMCGCSFLLWSSSHLLFSASVCHFFWNSRCLSERRVEEERDFTWDTVDPIFAVLGVTILMFVPGSVLKFVSFVLGALVRIKLDTMMFLFLFVLFLRCSWCCLLLYVDQTCCYCYLVASFVNDGFDRKVTDAKTWLFWIWHGLF